MLWSVTCSYKWWYYSYADNDILVEIGDLDATLPTTFANSTAPTHFLIEKVLVKVQVASGGTHVGNIQASATSGTATNSAVSSGTEIVGAGATAIRYIYFSSAK
jgi:hypothetical protein